MTLDSPGFATAIAAATAAAFGLAAGLFTWLDGLPRRRSPFSVPLAGEAAGRLRRHWRRLGQWRALLLAAFLSASLAGAALMLAEPPEAWRGMPAWLSWLAVIIAAGLATTLFVVAAWLTLKRRQLRRGIDARLAVGHALQRLTGNRNRTFHDVPTAFGGLDHVIVGLHGIYAVRVVAAKPGRQRELRLDGNDLLLGNPERRLSLKDTARRADRLARECAKMVAHDVHVRLVVAAPGWEVRSQASESLLLANERNLGMLTGWKDQRDYLLDEDVDALHAYLDERCARPARDFS